MSIAQQVGQWLGLVILAVIFGSIGYQFLRLARAVRGFLENRRRAQAFGELVAEKVQLRAELPEPKWVRFEPVMASPPCEMLAPETLRRGQHVAVGARRHGKTDELRRQVERYVDEGHAVFVNGRPYMTVKGAQTALVHRYSTPEEVMLLAFKHGGEGEIAIGARLDFERYIIDGDRPSLIEPRGIFPS